FPNKNALLGAMAEDSVTKFPTVDTHDWRSYFRTSLVGYRSWLLNSASAVLVPEINGTWARFNDEPSEAVLNLMESFFSLLDAAGFKSHQANEVWNLGTTLVVRSLIARLGDEEIADHFQALQKDVRSLGAENFPTLSEALSQEPPPGSRYVRAHGRGGHRGRSGCVRGRLTSAFRRKPIGVLCETERFALKSGCRGVVVNARFI
ncbi:MAG: hypothetical protein ACKVK6_01640, partial [bacterium]